MKNFIIIIFLCSLTHAFSQEVLSDLISNPLLFKNEISLQKNKSAIPLPFIDDFSNESTFVSDNLWDNSSVFVNRSYPINPPTIGVATSMPILSSFLVACLNDKS